MYNYPNVLNTNLIDDVFEPSMSRSVEVAPAPTETIEPVKEEIVSKEVVSKETEKTILGMPKSVAIWVGIILLVGGVYLYKKNSVKPVIPTV